MERDLTAVTNKNRPGERTSGEYSGDTEVHSITDAAAAHSEEMRQRMIKYAVAKGSDHAEAHSNSLIDYVPMGELGTSNSAETAGPGPQAAGDAPITLLQGELIDDDDEDHGRAAS